MKASYKIKYCSLVLCIILMCTEMTSGVPFYSDYENNDVGENTRGKDYQLKNKSIDIRDLYDLLLKKEAVNDNLGQLHQIIRKSNRSPSLRLRFGKKRDPYFMIPQAMTHSVRVLEDVDI